MTERYCEWPGCEKPAMTDSGTGKSHPLCAMHHQRRHRGSDMNAPPRERLDPDAALAEAAISWVDADTDEAADAEERRAWARLKATCRRLFGSTPAEEIKALEFGKRALANLKRIQSAGGIARAEKLSPQRRSEIASAAARARWGR